MILINKYVLVVLIGSLIQLIEADTKCSYTNSSSNLSVNVQCPFLCCNDRSAKNEEDACCTKYWTIGLAVGGAILLILIICVISVILCCCGVACSCLECLLCPCRKICC